MATTRFTDMELMELKEHIFSDMYDAHFEFNKAAQGMKEVAGDYANLAYGKFKALQKLIDDTGLEAEYEAWKANNGLEY